MHADGKEKLAGMFLISKSSVLTLRFLAFNFKRELLSSSSCFSGDAGCETALLNGLHVCVPLYVISNTVGSSSDLCTCFVAQQFRTRRYGRLRCGWCWCTRSGLSNGSTLF